MPETSPEDNISIKRKKLLYRSWHRGTREADLLLGHFAESHLPGLDEQGLGQYEAMLAESDPDLFNWISGLEPLPEAKDSPVLRLLMAFYRQK